MQDGIAMKAGFVCASGDQLIGTGKLHRDSSHLGGNERRYDLMKYHRQLNCSPKDTSTSLRMNVDLISMASSGPFDITSSRPISALQSESSLIDK